MKHTFQLFGQPVEYTFDPRDQGPLLPENFAAIQTYLDGKQRTAPPPKYDLPGALQAMNDFVESIGPRLRGYVPTDERDSWSAKLEEATAYLADNNSPTPIMDAEVALTSETVAALAPVVVAKGTAYKTYAGQIAGLRRATKAALEAAGDPNDYETVLAAAQVQAETMLPDA